MTETNIHDIASVPLFVKEPAQHEARIVDRHVRNVDIVPTIADVLGAPLPYEADGVSLFEPTNDRSEVVVAQRVGKTIGADADDVARRNYETLAHMLAVFGSGRTGDLFAIGPHRELVGRPVSELPVARGRGVRASVDGETLLRSVDLDSALAPSHVTGQLEGERARAGILLAVAVNGRIGAVTKTFGGDAKFSAFVAESAFRQGANDVEVFAVGERGDAVVLERLGGVGRTASYALVDTSSGEAVRTSGGRELPVVAGAVEGVVEDWFFEEDTVRIGGWAGDVATRKAAEKVLVFSERGLLYSGTPSVGRADLGERYPGLGRSGFVVELPRDLVGDGSDADLRFFAMRGDVASELAYADGFPWKAGQ